MLQQNVSIKGLPILKCLNSYTVESANQLAVKFSLAPIQDRNLRMAFCPVICRFCIASQIGTHAQAILTPGHPPVRTLLLHEVIESGMHDSGQKKYKCMHK